MSAAYIFQIRPDWRTIFFLEVTRVIYMTLFAYWYPLSSNKDKKFTEIVNASPIMYT